MFRNIFEKRSPVRLWMQAEGEEVVDLSAIMSGMTMTNIMDGQLSCDLELRVLGQPSVDYSEYITQFREGDLWECKYCNNPNPKRAKLKNYRPEQEVCNCLKCGASRPIVYG
jgi:hypothetical protein